MPYQVPDLNAGPIGNVPNGEHFFTKVTFGATGAVSAYYKKGGITFARNSAGNYTLSLPQPYRYLLDWSCGIQDASGAILFLVLVTDTVDVDGKLVFEFRTEAGVATDPTSGDKLFLRVLVSKDLLLDQWFL